MMGISWDAVPSLAFSLLDGSVLIYPESEPVTKDHLMTWIDDAFRGKIIATKVGLGREIKDHEI